MATLTDPTGRGRKARTITATDPATGATFDRRTDRLYVAVVITGDPAQGQAWAHSWAGRPDLAAKALAKWGPDSHARLAPVTSDPWAAPEATPAPVATAAPEPAATPAALTPAAAAALEARLWAREEAAAGVTPAAAPVAQAPVTSDPLSFEARAVDEMLAALADVAAEPEPATPAARVTLPGEPPAAPPVPPAPGGGVAAHRAAAAAGRPVSLAALARDLGRGLGLASGGRLPARYGATGDLPARPAPAAALTGDPLEGLPWDPGTPEARARHAEQGRTAARLYPIAQAATGAGCTLPPSWWSDGPALNGELPPMRALEALPLPTLAAAAAALAALPPVTEAQAQGLAYCRAALRAAAARL